MKKFWVFVSAIFIALLFSGCEYVLDEYPCVEFCASNYRYDRRNKMIVLDKDSCINDSNPYDIVETETGYNLILHFERMS